MILFDNKNECSSIKNKVEDNSICPSNCTSCLSDQPTICITCQTDYGMLYGEQSCRLTSEICFNYYFDNISNKYKKCNTLIANCEYCLAFFNELSYCVFCENNYIIIDYNYLECSHINITLDENGNNNNLYFKDIEDEEWNYY